MKLISLTILNLNWLIPILSIIVVIWFIEKNKPIQKVLPVLTHAVSIWALLLTIPFPLHPFPSSNTILQVAPIMTIWAIIILNYRNNNKPIENFIQIDIKKLEFGISKTYSENHKIVYYEILLKNDFNFLKYINQHANTNVEENEILVGMIYVEKNTNVIFEDRLAVKRKFNDFEFIEEEDEFEDPYNEPVEFIDIFNSIKIDYEVSSILLPFVTRNWKFEFDLNDYNQPINSNDELSEDLKSRIIEHYTNCNKESIQKQRLINFKSNTHQKFALMNQILRSNKHGDDYVLNEYLARYIGGRGSFFKNNKRIYLYNNANADLVFAVNQLIENNLIVLNGDICNSTTLGKVAPNFGFDKAAEYNNLKVNERWIEIRRNITMWTSIAAVATGFILGALTQIGFSKK